MDVVRFTRELVDIESISGNERAVGEFLLARLGELGWRAEAMPVEPNRFNVYATAPNGEPPELVFSTHMDTVPPHIASSEDDDRVWGRGACDAKGIIAAQVAAAERLRRKGARVALLFLVGEERDSLGAKVANERPPGARFLINGEPTDNRIARASKGALRVEIIARGRMAHSAYPELGESAIEKLLLAFPRLYRIALPVDPDIGPTTMNIGVIEGGRAPNVIPDYARAQLLYRLVGPAADLRRQIEAAVAGLAEANTDIPALSRWGEPLLLGPGSIHVAHTEREHIAKRELHAAVELYVDVAQRMLTA